MKASKLASCGQLDESYIAKSAFTIRA